jgi:hypothetical protein
MSPANRCVELAVSRHGLFVCLGQFSETVRSAPSVTAKILAGLDAEDFSLSGGRLNGKTCRAKCANDSADSPVRLSGKAATPTTKSNLKMNSPHSPLVNWRSWRTSTLGRLQANQFARAGFTSTVTCKGLCFTQCPSRRERQTQGKSEFAWRSRRRRKRVDGRIENRDRSASVSAAMPKPRTPAIPFALRMASSCGVAHCIPWDKAIRHYGKECSPRPR